MPVSFWKNMQQQSGWPLGPLGTLAAVTIGPLALWAFIHAFFWSVAAAGNAVLGAAGY